MSELEPVVLSARSKRKKKKKSKGSKVAAPSPPVTKESLSAREALTSHLRSKLRARRSMIRTAARGGTTQEVQKIMQDFNDGDAEKADLMKDIQEDVKGMKPKDAKRYLKQVISGMNPDQTDSFVDMVKDKIPGQSNEIVNYVKRQRKVKEVQDSTKPQVCEESVYTPARLMTEEQKHQEKEKRKAEEDPVKKKRKKTFGPVSIQIPKLNELREHPTSGQESDPVHVPPPRSVSDNKHDPRKKKKTFGNNAPGLDDIHNLFSDHAVQEKERQRYSYEVRLKNIQTFDLEQQTLSMRQYLFESAGETELVRVVDVQFMTLSLSLPIPDTDTILSLSDVPESCRAPLIQNGEFSDEHWTYTALEDKLDVHQGQVKYSKSQNAYRDCITFMSQVSTISDWITSLKGHKIPWRWFLDVLNEYGIMMQKSIETREDLWTECFRILCMEYNSTAGQVTVPIIPYFKLTLKMS